MANSGTVYTGYVQDSRFWFSWTLKSQSVVNNTSTISWSCGLTTPYYYYSNAVKMSAISFAGGQVYGGGTYSNIFSETRTLASGTKTVTHNNDGTLRISVSGFTGYLYNQYGGYDSASYGGGSWDLPTIARASTFDVNATSLIANNSDIIIATINKKNSAFTDRLTMTFGSKSAEFTINNNSATVKVPESWASVIPNATSGTATLTLTTYNGNSVIGSSSKSITILVKNYSPTLSITSIAPVSTPAVFSSVNYVQSLSKVRVRSSASGYQGSTITEQKVSILNKGYDGSDITSDFLSSSGIVQILVTCVDSRGKTNAVIRTITVVEYYPPTVSIEVSSSQAEGKNTINVSTRISSVNGLNAKTYKLLGTWIDEDGTVHTDEQLASGNITNPDFTLYHNSIDPSITYTYRVRVDDSVGYDIAEGITGVIAISRYKGGRGVRFFGEAEKNGLDFNSKLTMMFGRNKSGVPKSLLNLIHPVGSLIYNSDPNFDPNVEWGGIWQRIEGHYLYSPKLVDGEYDYPLGSTIEAGLPNIEGQIDGNWTASGLGSSASNVIGTGSLRASVLQTTNKYAYSGGSYFGSKINMDASLANSIYGNSDTVRPRSFVANAWLRLPDRHGFILGSDKLGEGML